MNFETYRIFYYTARYKNITGAAKALFLTQPTVSHAIAGLEKELGCQLFIRSKKGVQMTPEAELLYRHLSKAFQHVEDGEQSLRDHLSLSEGQIRIGASDMTLQYYLLPYLESFHSKYPNVKIRVTNGPTPETVKALRAGEIDFGIVTTPVISDKWMTVTPVRKIQDCFVAGIKFIGLKGKTLSLAELAKYPLTMLEKKTSSRRYIDNLFVQEGCVVQPEFELATSDLIVQFALRGLGIGYVTQDFAQPYLDRGQLFKLQLADPIARRSMCLITPTQFPMPLAAKRLIEEELRDEKDSPIHL